MAMAKERLRLRLHVETPDEGGVLALVDEVNRAFAGWCEVVGEPTTERYWKMPEQVILSLELACDDGDAAFFAARRLCAGWSSAGPRSAVWNPVGSSFLIDPRVRWACLEVG